MATFTIRY